MSLPAELIEARRRVAAMFITGGVGIEIGALYASTPLPAAAKVRYVDQWTSAQLHERYPKLDASEFVPVDVIDDGERLDTFQDDSVDFVIANHMLEHCENPLGTLRNHLRKVRRGGWLYYAIPDRRVGFDTERPITTFDHLVADDRDGGAGSRFGHYVEWARLVNHIDDERAADENARANIAARYSIHFHVWEASAWLDFLVRAREYLNRAFEVRYFEMAHTEIVCVLRRE